MEDRPTMDEKLSSPQPSGLTKESTTASSSNGNGKGHGSSSKKKPAIESKKESTPAKKKARMSTGSTPKNALTALDGKGISTVPKGSKSTAKKSATPGASAAAKKRKIEELEKDVADIKMNLEKMKKDKAKLQRTIEEQIKFPIRDDLIVSVDLKGKQPLPLPQALASLSLPQELVSDAIGVWDFLNNFRKQMSLNAISIDSMIDLLNFKGRESPALTELFCAPLKLLLSDTKIASKLSAAIPRRLNFASKTGVVSRSIIIDQSSSSSSVMNQVHGNQEIEIEFDSTFNGIRLLPRRLRPELVDSLSWQALLRVVLLRLDPIKQLKKAAAEVPESAPIPAPIRTTGMTVGKLKRKAEEGEEFQPSDAPTSSSSPSSASTKNSFYSTLEDARNSVMQTAVGTEAIVNSSISTGGVKKLTINTLKKNHLNKDHLFLVTSDPRQDLTTTLEAAVLLETKELHSLSVVHKLAALKAVCDACYDTQRLSELLASNADERVERMTIMAKKIREDKAKSKEVSDGRSKDAFEKCREINIQAFEVANAAAIAAGATKGKGKKATALLKGPLKASLGPKPKGWKEHDPSPAQVAAMLDEMALLEKIGVDEVVESLFDEEPLEEEEEEDEENEYTIQADGSYGLTARNRAAVRGKANDKKKLRVEYESRLFQINQAKDALQRALATGAEKEVRLAIKQAVKAGLRGRSDDGSSFCTDLLKQVYKVQIALDTKAKEEKVESAYDRELSELCVRSSPLGTDRFHRCYWVFAHSQNDEQRLFVQSDATLAGFKTIEVKSELGAQDGETMQASQVCSVPEENTYAGTLIKNIPKSVKDKDGSQDRSRILPAYILSAAAGQASILSTDQSLCRLIASRPSARVSRWGIYTAAELWSLCEALDDRGERESSLKAAIKARFDITEPPPVFFKAGNEFIGKEVVRYHKRRRVEGLIVGWLPASGDDCALWHIQHSDGDGEDLELHEVIEGIAAAKSSSAIKPAKELVMREEEAEDIVNDANVDQTEKRESSRVKALSVTEASRKVMNSCSDLEALAEEMVKEKEPTIVASNMSVMIGHQGMKLAMIGAQGVRGELLRVHGLLLEGLKRRGSSYSKDREAKKSWENLVRNAEEVRELRSALQELEAVARGVQKIEDMDDDEEARRDKVEARAYMLTEGWIFERLKEKEGGIEAEEADEKEESKDEEAYRKQLEFIGLPLRRFFSGHGLSDGIIVGYLPASRNEGMELWRMEHQDGDEEDLDHVDVKKGTENYILKKLEDDEKEFEEEEEEEQEEEAVEELEEEEELANGEINSTLWPTAGVRSRWLEALQRSKTLGEVALALSLFVEYSKNFGLMNEEEVEEIIGRQRKNKIGQILGVSQSPHRKKKGKSSANTSVAQGRSQRSTRAVVVYGE